MDSCEIIFSGERPNTVRIFMHANKTFELKKSCKNILE